MKKKSLLIVAFAMLLLSLLKSEAAVIQVCNPNYSSWYSYGSVIQTCSLFVKPKGIYCQYDLEMAVGVSGNFSNALDSLEINYQFTLPTDWTINDSWLWVGDTIVPAMLIDRSKATEIYESYVSRRTDPSLLTWDTYGAANLRVYPLFADKTRKFRISFLAPSNWTIDNITSELSATLLPNNVSQFDIFIRDDNEFKFANALTVNKSIVNANDIHKDTIETIGFSRYSVQNYQYSQPISISYDRVNKSNVFFDICEKNNEKYYQMALIYPEIENNRPAKKVLFAYDMDKFSEAKSGTCAKLTSSMNTILNTKDSFNLLLSGATNKFVFDKWMPASKDNLDSAIRALKAHTTNSLTYFHNVMLSINDFVKDETEYDVTSVLLLTSDITYNSADKTMDEYSYLRGLLNYRVKINIGMFYENANNNGNAYYNGFEYNGNYYRYNQLLCYNISAFTQGMVETDLNHCTYNYNDGYYYYYDNIMPLFEAYYNQNLYGTNLLILMNDGFSYLDNVVASNSAYSLMCGKIYGDDGITVKITGFDGENPFSKSYPVQNIISTNNYKNNQFSAFAEMKKLSKEQQSKSITEEIVKFSTKNRVISQYTAFLALEPWLMNINEKYDYNEAENAGDKDNGGEATGVADPTNSLDIKLIYNSINSSLAINIKNSDSKMEVESVRIYDLSGRELHHWQIEDMNNPELNLTWQFGEEISNGTVIVMIETNKGTISKKINILR